MSAPGSLQSADRVLARARKCLREAARKTNGRHSRWRNDPEKIRFRKKGEAAVDRSGGNPLTRSTPVELSVPTCHETCTRLVF